MLTICTPKTLSYRFLSKLPRIQLCSGKFLKDVRTVLSKPYKERVPILIMNAKYTQSQTDLLRGSENTPVVQYAVQIKL